MKSTAFLLAFFFASFLCAHAQYDAKTSVASVGIGVGSSLGSFTYGSQSPAMSLQYEHGIHQAGPGVISGGVYLGYKTYSYTYANDYKAKWDYVIVGLRGAYHYTGFDIPKLDVYGGIMISYNALHYSDSYYNGVYNYGSKAGFSIYAGGKYFFSNHLGAFAELGYGVAYLNVGLSLKF